MARSLSPCHVCPSCARTDPRTQGSLIRRSVHGSEFPFVKLRYPLAPHAACCKGKDLGRSLFPPFEICSFSGIGAGSFTTSPVGCALFCRRCYLTTGGYCYGQTVGLSMDR